jgi:hypothetical protein
MWHTVVPAAMLSMNMKVHTTLKASPFHLMMGRSPFSVNVPKTSIVDADVVSAQEEVSLSQWTLFWETFKRDIVNQVYIIRKRGIANSSYPHKTTEFEIGQTVYCLVPNRKSKFANRYEGPYRIKNVDSDGLYLLEGSDNIEFVVPSQFIKVVELEEGEQLHNKTLIEITRDSGISDEDFDDSDNEELDLTEPTIVEDNEDDSDSDNEMGIDNDDDDDFIPDGSDVFEDDHKI